MVQVIDVVKYNIQKCSDRIHEFNRRDKFSYSGNLYMQRLKHKSLKHEATIWNIMLHLELQNWDMIGKLSIAKEDLCEAGQRLNVLREKVNHGVRTFDHFIDNHGQFAIRVTCKAKRYWNVENWKEKRV